MTAPACDGGVSARTDLVRRIGPREFDFARQVAVMAIVNRTPDSFYDRGRTDSTALAVEAGLRAIAEGADWVDVGGAKFAPGPPVPVAEELDRVVPVVEGLANAGAVISVDTFHAEVARAAIAAGAHVVNDTTGFSDPSMAEVVAETGATVVVTHSLAKPRTPYPHPHYDDVVGEVAAFLRGRVALAEAAGVASERIVVDPGHDLNKHTLHSLELTRRLAEITSLGYPTLVALSNKDFVGESLGRRDRSDRVEGSLAAAVACIMRGARIVRVHNVRQTVDAVRMFEAIEGWREPVFLEHNR